MSLTRPPVPSVLVAVALTPLSGCSFLFVDGPPAQHRQLAYFDCSSSYVAPAVDTVWAGLNGIGALRAAAASDGEWNLNTSREATIAVGLVWLALSGSSAIYGYSKVGACKEAKTELMMRSRQPAPGPSTWPPPPPAGGYPPSFPPPAQPPASPPAQPPASPPAQPPASPATPPAPPQPTAPPPTTPT